MPAYLADTSALTRRATRPDVRQAVEPLLLAGETATCGIVDLALLYSATGPAADRERGLEPARDARRARRALTGRLTGYRQWR